MVAASYLLDLGLVEGLDELLVLELVLADLDGGTDHGDVDALVVVLLGLDAGLVGRDGLSTLAVLLVGEVAEGERVVVGGEDLDGVGGLVDVGDEELLLVEGEGDEVGGRGEDVVDLVLSEDAGAGHVALGVAVLAGLGGLDLDELDGAVLHDDESTLLAITGGDGAASNLADLRHVDLTAKEEEKGRLRGNVDGKSVRKRGKREENR